MTYSLNTLTDAAPAPSGPRAGLARFAHETALVLGAVALVFCLIALVSHSAGDAAFSTSGDGGPVRNWNSLPDQFLDVSHIRLLIRSAE